MVPACLCRLTRTEHLFLDAATGINAIPVVLFGWWFDDGRCESVLTLSVKTWTFSTSVNLWLWFICCCLRQFYFWIFKLFGASIKPAAGSWLLWNWEETAEGWTCSRDQWWTCFHTRDGTRGVLLTQAVMQRLFRGSSRGWRWWMMRLMLISSCSSVITAHWKRVKKKKTRGRASLRTERRCRTVSFRKFWSKRYRTTKPPPRTWEHLNIITLLLFPSRCKMVRLVILNFIKEKKKKKEISMFGSVGRWKRPKSEF